MNSEEIRKLDQKYIIGTYKRFSPVLVSGRGALCRSAEGKEYVDFTSGIGVNSLGFCPPDWAAAVGEQLETLQHTSNLYYTLPQIRLAEKLCRRTGASGAFFCNSGAEANEVAIKAARKHGSTKRGIDDNRIITLKDSFHGRTMATITATGQEHYHRDFTPFPEGFDYCSPDDAGQLEALMGENTCAVMIELIQGEGGVNDLSVEFAKAAEKLCRERGILLLVDEVQTGVGRTGSLFAFEQYGIRPDILTFAKGIGGGLPLGGALFFGENREILKPGDHGSTFGGNPAVCAGALAVLDTLDEAKLAEIAALGDYLRARLGKHSAVKSISGRGLMVGLELAGNKKASRVVEAAMEKGLLVLTAADKVRLLPPLTITKEELDRGLSALEEALKEA